MSMKKVKSHSEYISGFPPQVQRKLKQMRALIRKEVPSAIESISYGIAGFSLDGPLVYIGGFKDHVSFFPTSSGVEAFKGELSRYKTSAGTIQFPLDEDLPLDLLRRIVRFRLSENRHKKTGRSLCDKKWVAEIDDSKLAEELRVLVKPAQRALIHAKLYTLEKISRKSEAELLQLHGLGPSSIPVLSKLLLAKKLAFRSR